MVMGINTYIYLYIYILGTDDLMLVNTILLGQKPSGNSFATFLWYRLPM